MVVRKYEGYSGRMRWGMMGGGYAGHYWKDEVGDMRV